MKKFYLVIFILLCVCVIPIKAQYNVLFNFNGTNGYDPYGSVTLSGNVLYGMTSNGGAYREGNVFSIHKDGTQFKDLFDFNYVDGWSPTGSLVLFRNKLYGMTYGGGAHQDGNIFSIDTDGTQFNDLFDFDGANGHLTWGSLTLSDGKLFGMTWGGGPYYNSEGTIFSIDTNGNNFKSLFSFIDAGSWGMGPMGDVIIVGGKLYGMTYAGGPSQLNGCIFSIDTDGNGYNQIHDFNGTDGKNPTGDVTYSEGKLYGMTDYGGAHGLGCVFSMDTNGNNYKDFLDFDDTNGAYPVGSLTLLDGILYGMTYMGGAHDSGCLFSIDTNGSGYRNLFDNFDKVNGSEPQFTRVTFSGNALYGMTIEGGVSGVGVIFSDTLIRDSANVSANALCYGGSNGSASVTGTEGAAPYTYFWSGGGGTNATATGLSAGTYTVIVTDADSLTTFAMVTITQSPSLLVSYPTDENITCNGLINGYATANVTNGTMPYTYLWTGGNTNAGETGLSAGTYTLIITDSNGCSTSSSVTITQPLPISITQGSTNNITNPLGVCNGLAFVNVISGGTEPYTYLWSPGNQTTDTIQNQCGGIYCCKVTDANGCLDSTCVTIENETGVNVIGNNASVNIFPDPSNGIFTVAIYKSSAACQFMVYNILGEKIYNATLKQGQSDNIVNLKDQPEGIYLYRLLSEDGELIREGKLVIQR